MTGYKVTVKDYPGNLTGDETVYTDKGAALYVEERAKLQELRNPRSEERADVEFESVEYDGFDEHRCLVGRVVHNLTNVDRKTLVRGVAISKLNAEEREALGVS